MNRIHGTRTARAAWLAVLVPVLMIAPACTLEPGYGYGYDGTTNIGVGIDYYEPLGFDYGGWGGNYRAGPPRGGPRGGGGRGGASHAYRSAPASHGMPSLPSGPRGGGGGGGRGGGGGGRR
jgi:hypothetical protein